MNRETLKLCIILFCGSLAGLFLTSLCFSPHDRPGFLFCLLTMIFTAGIMQVVIWRLYLSPLKKLAAKLKEVPEHPLSFSEVSLRQDEIGFLTSRLNDMTGAFRRQVESAVAQKEEIRTVLMSMSEGVLVVGSDKKVLHASRAAVRMLDLRVMDPVGRYYWEVIRHNEIGALIETGLETRSLFSRELAIPGTEEAYFSAHMAPVMVAGGRLHSIVVVVHDISALKKYDRMRSEFVANVSHELKTPLTSIKGFAETLKAGGLDDRPTALRFLGIIENQTLRLEKLVADILLLSSVESGHEADSPEQGPQFLPGIIHEVLELQRISIVSKGHVVEVQIAEDLKPILGNRVQLEQVFLNLIDNAIKFTPDKGTIRVLAGNEENMVRVDIKDTGIGIPAEHLDRLFERFYRVDKARSQAMGGTGLGLAIVKHIVQVHHGRLAIQSQSGKGSTFTVFLPCL